MHTAANHIRNGILCQFVPAYKLSRNTQCISNNGTKNCAFDKLIFPGGTVDVYRRMINSLGGEDKSLDTLRFFLTPGGSHCGHYALGITLADGMIALMNWVEKGIVPETMPLEMKDIRFNPAPTVQQATAGLYKLSEHPDFEFANNSVFDV